VEKITIRENGSMLVIQGGNYRLPISTFSMISACEHALRAGATYEGLDSILEDYKRAKHNQAWAKNPEVQAEAARVIAEHHAALKGANHA